MRQCRRRHPGKSSDNAALDHLHGARNRYRPVAFWAAVLGGGDMELIIGASIGQSYFNWRVQRTRWMAQLFLLLDATKNILLASRSLLALANHASSGVVLPSLILTLVLRLLVLVAGMLQLVVPMELQRSRGQLVVATDVVVLLLLLSMHLTPLGLQQGLKAAAPAHFSGRTSGIVSWLLLARTILQQLPFPWLIADAVLCLVMVSTFMQNISPAWFWSSGQGWYAVPGWLTLFLSSASGIAVAVCIEAAHATCFLANLPHITNSWKSTHTHDPDSALTSHGTECPNLSAECANMDSVCANLDYTCTNSTSAHDIGEAACTRREAAGTTRAAVCTNSDTGSKDGGLEGKSKVPLLPSSSSGDEHSSTGPKGLGPAAHNHQNTAGKSSGLVQVQPTLESATAADKHARPLHPVSNSAAAAGIKPDAHFSRQPAPPNPKTAGEQDRLAHASQPAHPPCAVSSVLYRSRLQHRIVSAKVLNDTLHIDALQALVQPCLAAVSAAQGLNRAVCTPIWFCGCWRVLVQLTGVAAASAADAALPSQSGTLGLDADLASPDLFHELGSTDVCAQLAASLQQALPVDAVVSQVLLTAAPVALLAAVVPQPVAVIAPPQYSKDLATLHAEPQWLLHKLVLRLPAKALQQQPDTTAIRVVLSLPYTTTPLYEQRWSRSALQELPRDEDGGLKLLLSGLAAAGSRDVSTAGKPPLLLVVVLREGEGTQHTSAHAPAAEHLIASASVLLLPHAAACAEVSALLEQLVQECGGDFRAAYSRHLYPFMVDLSHVLCPVAAEALGLQVYASLVIAVLQYTYGQHMPCCHQLVLQRLQQEGPDGTMDAVRAHLQHMGGMSIFSQAVTAQLTGMPVRAELEHVGRPSASWLMTSGTPG